jgi:cleavage and polyadenylation specificity factor subunit 3
MTHPTKAIYNTLLKDFVKVSKGGSDEGLYSDKDLEASLERVEVCDFHQTIDLDGIKASARYRWRIVTGLLLHAVACIRPWIAERHRCDC